MSQPSDKPPHNVWCAPPNAQSQALRGLRLTRPSPEEMAALAASAVDWRTYAGAYETPLTDEAMRWKVSCADVARSACADDSHRVNVT